MKWSPLFAGIVICPLLLISGGDAKYPNIPADYLREAEDIPEFWVSTLEGANRFLDEHVRAGEIDSIGTSAGVRPDVGTDRSLVVPSPEDKPYSAFAGPKILHYARGRC